MPQLRTLRLSRLIVTLALAYALALKGLLGAMGGAAFAAEIRLANQLGLICTIHGPALPDGQTGSDPTPGRMACIEHCLLGSGTASSGLAPAVSVLPVQRPRLLGATDLRLPGITVGILAERPPPQRGPPAA